MKAKMKETEADKAVTRAALENAGVALLAIVEELEDLAERMADLKDAAAAKLSAAKAQGYDVKAVRAVLKQRAKTPEALKAQEELGLVADTYLAALEVAANA